MTREERAMAIANKVEALAWADNWTVHKAIPFILEQLDGVESEVRQALSKEVYRYVGHHNHPGPCKVAAFLSEVIASRTQHGDSKDG